MKKMRYTFSKRLILSILIVTILSSCNNDTPCDYYLINQELKLNESIHEELLFCTAYRDFLTDGQPQDIFVLKIESQLLEVFLEENKLYKKFSDEKTNGVLSPSLLIQDLYNEVKASRKKEEYKEIIDRITPENSYYFYSKRENYFVESLIDKSGYIVLSVNR